MHIADVPFKADFLANRAMAQSIEHSRDLLERETSAVNGAFDE